MKQTETMQFLFLAICQGRIRLNAILPLQHPLSLSPNSFLKVAAEEHITAGRLDYLGQNNCIEVKIIHGQAKITQNLFWDIFGVFSFFSLVGRGQNRVKYPNAHLW